jgi:hypothetical protein
MASLSFELRLADTEGWPCREKQKIVAQALGRALVAARKRWAKLPCLGVGHSADRCGTHNAGAKKG